MLESIKKGSRKSDPFFIGNILVKDSILFINDDFEKILKIPKFDNKKMSMQSINIIRNNLIDKILTIKSQEFLTALYKLIESSSTESKVELNEEQKLMLLMSEDDIKAGRIIAQDELDHKDLLWLKEQ